MSASSVTVPQRRLRQRSAWKTPFLPTLSSRRSFGTANQAELLGGDLFKTSLPGTHPLTGEQSASVGTGGPGDRECQTGQDVSLSLLTLRDTGSCFGIYQPRNEALDAGPCASGDGHDDMPGPIRDAQPHLPLNEDETEGDRVEGAVPYGVDRDALPVDVQTLQDRLARMYVCFNQKTGKWRFCRRDPAEIPARPRTGSAGDVAIPSCPAPPKPLLTPEYACVVDDLY
ncbi:hypothetical protein Bbelb_322700 [Branchiostoma belcheri]|nr:hypothetical protein Bbelb_322700 [Branchiostoma belcheri]